MVFGAQLCTHSKCDASAISVNGTHPGLNAVALAIGQSLQEPDPLCRNLNSVTPRSCHSNVRAHHCKSGLWMVTSRVNWRKVSQTANRRCKGEGE